MHNSVIGEDGTSHEISEFSTLPAGEYTVVLEGSAGSYYNERYCRNIYISYKVTIKQRTETTYISYTETATTSSVTEATTTGAETTHISYTETETTSSETETTATGAETTATGTETTARGTETTATGTETTATGTETTAISVEKLFGTWSEETPHNPGDLPIVFSFYEDGTARISWKNDPSGYYVPITWSTEDDILQYHEDVEDGSDASYFISFSDDTLVLKKTKGGEPAYVLNKESLPLGDVNNDGKVDAKDASLILVEYASLSTDGKSVLSDEAKTAADVNKDGKADSKDASAVLQYYAYTSTGGTDSIEVFLK